MKNKIKKSKTKVAKIYVGHFNGLENENESMKCLFVCIYEDFFVCMYV